MPEIMDLSHKAEAAYAAGEYSRAAGLFAAAAEEYQKVGDLRSAAEQANNRSVALLKARQARAALKACEGSDLVFASHGDTNHQAMALCNQAAAHEALHHWKEAGGLYQQAAELFHSLGQNDMYALSLKNLSAVLLRRGQFLQALVVMQTALREKTILTVTERILRFLLRIPFRLLR